MWPDADCPSVGIGSFGTGRCHARLKRLAFGTQELGDLHRGLSCVRNDDHATPASG